MKVASANRLVNPAKGVEDVFTAVSSIRSSASSRPSTAPSGGRSRAPGRVHPSVPSDSPFAMVTPVLNRSEVRAAMSAHRTYSAGRIIQPKPDESRTSRKNSAVMSSGSGGPRNHEFISTTFAWSVGPGSYSTDRPEKHTPTFEYTHPTTLGPELTGALKKISSRSSSSTTDIDHVAPRRPKPHQLRGPLISHTFAYSHVNHSREEMLKAELAAAIAKPTATTVRLLMPESSFSMKNSQSRGSTIPVGDLGYRSKLGPPSGPSLSDSIRPEWEKLQTYVPPAVIGPSAVFSSTNFISQVDDDGTPLNSQAKLKALRDAGVDVNNWVERNRFAQGRQTREAKTKRISDLNASDAVKRQRAHAYLAEKEQLAWKRYEESTLEKDLAYRAERRRRLQEQADLIRFQSSWLKLLTISTGLEVFRSLREQILRQRLQHFAARKIWNFWKAWKQRCQARIVELTSKRRPRSGFQPIRLSHNHASPNGSARGTNHTLPSTLSRALSSLQREISPRSNVSSTPATPTSHSPSLKDRGLNSLLQLQTNQMAAHVIAEFLDWSIMDRFKKLKHAMLAFRRKALTIQRWWRGHLLAQQWRLWIQAIQFMQFRERSLKAEAHHRSQRTQNRIIAANTAQATGGDNKRRSTNPTPTRQRSHSPNRSRMFSSATSSFSAHHSFHRFDDDDEKFPTVPDPDDASHVTFASDSHSVNSTVAGVTATKLAQRIWSHWLIEGEADDGTSILSSKRPLRKFHVPTRNGSSVMIHQWNSMVHLQREVFFERLRRSRMDFKAWLKSMRIAGMREELMAHSNTVKPLTPEEKAAIERGELNIAPVANRLRSRDRIVTIAGVDSSEDETSSSSSDDDSGGGGNSSNPNRRAPLTTVQHVRLSREAKLAARSNIYVPSLAGVSSFHSSRPGRREKVSSSSSTFLARLQTPHLFRLLLTDAELMAMYRAVNILIANPHIDRSRDGHVHSFHLLTHRTVDDHIYQGAPILVGQKAALKRLFHDRIATLAKDARETALAEEAAKVEQAIALSTSTPSKDDKSSLTKEPTGKNSLIQSWPDYMRTPILRSTPSLAGTSSASHTRQTSGHFIVNLTKATEANRKSTKASTKRASNYKKSFTATPQ